MKLSISQITTVTQSFADDLDAYRAAGADGIGIWEMKLTDDSLEQFRASGLEAAAAVPEVPSILPLPLMEGPADPAERVEAITNGIARLAPFEPSCVAFLTGPGDDSETVVEGIRSIAEAGRAHGVRVALEPIQREFAHFWTSVSSLDESAALIDEAGADVGLLFDSWQLHGEPLEEVERHRDRICAASTSPTGATRRGTRTTASSRATGSSTSARSSTPCAGTGSTTWRSSPTSSCPTRSGRRIPRRARGARDRGDAEDGIERVCIVGGGVIGSLYAGHLARVCEVSVLCRREEHARALNEHGLRVSGRHEFEAQVRAATDPASSPSPSLRSSPPRRPSSRPPQRASRATGRARR